MFNFAVVGIFAVNLNERFDMDVDNMVIHFDEGQLRMLNYCLGFMMFGVALELKVKDFIRVFLNPKSTLIGLTSQLVLLPLFTFLLVILWDAPDSMKLGLLMVAACPGGNVSNYLVHRSGGNTALSITLTSVVTMTSIVLTPLLFYIYSTYFFKIDAGKDLAVDPGKMIWILVQLILIPLILGMTLNHYLPNLVKKVKSIIKSLSIFLLLTIIAVALYKNISNLEEYLFLVFWLVLIHNGVSYVIGYYWSKWCKEPEENARAVCFETGIQNAGLGLILIFNFFDGLGGMALVAGWWGVWDLVSGFLLSEYWSKGLVKRVLNTKKL
ncbi:bile acid:sodium symporter family protein [Membranihabitans maritimus]|uniref:bile acid:sodium symporter family protein n=1 Tax=Membranihabitans maritimus TaxID=2904244 RepID=UPI001F2AAF02|nr:bile acid:sodium symporter family protein [Membranihabitans maritimus]